MALGLQLHQGFTVSYMDPKALVKALLSVDGCQIIVVEGKIREGSSYSTILLTSLPSILSHLLRLDICPSILFVLVNIL